MGFYLENRPVMDIWTDGYDLHVVFEDNEEHVVLTNYWFHEPQYSDDNKVDSVKFSSFGTPEMPS